MIEAPFLLVLYPMRHHGAALEDWRWPDAVCAKFGKFQKKSGQIWIDAASELPEELFSLMRDVGMPRPCTSHMGYAAVSSPGPHHWFQLRLRETMELLQEDDNFVEQSVSGWGFPLQRAGVSGCARGNKVRRASYRFGKGLKRPKYDFFWIVPGPRINGGVFGTTAKALDAMLSSGLTEFDHRPILTFAGGESCFHEIEVTALSSAPVRYSGFQSEQVCEVCGLNLVYPSRSREMTSIPPPDVELGESDFQVMKAVDVGGRVVYSDFWPPVVSRKFVDVVVEFALTGNDRGAAGGSHEPFITRAFAERWNAWRASFS